MTPLDVTAPVLEAPAAQGDAVCRRCGLRPHPTRANVCEKGHFLRANRAAVKSNAYSFRDRGPAALAGDLRGAFDAWRDDLVREQGSGGLSVVMQGHCDRLAELETFARLLRDDIVRRGFTDARGRVRSSYDRYLTTIDRWLKVAAVLGVDRKLKPASLAAYLAAQAEKDEP